MSNLGFGSGSLSQGVAINYGSDLSCVTDLDPGMIEVSGLVLLGQALARRIITPRGTLIDDPNYGFDVRQFLNDDLTPADVARIGSGIDGELVKDQRVFACRSQVTLTATGVLTVVTNVSPSVGPNFSLVVAVTATTVALLQPTT